MSVKYFEVKYQKNLKAITGYKSEMRINLKNTQEQAKFKEFKRVKISELR